MAKAQIECTKEMLEDLIAIGHMRHFRIEIVSLYITDNSCFGVIKSPTIPAELEGKSVTLTILKEYHPEKYTDFSYTQAYLEFTIRWGLDVSKYKDI